MNTLQIKRTCRKCGHKEVRTIPGQELATDFCALAQLPCDTIKDCDPAAKIPRTRRNARRGVLNLRDRINEEIDRLKQEGKDFCPADIGKLFGVDSKQVTQNIRDRPDVYRKVRCSCMTVTGPKASVWGFREVEA